MQRLDRHGNVDVTPFKFLYFQTSRCCLAKCRSMASCGGCVVLWRISESARTARPSGGIAVAPLIKREKEPFLTKLAIAKVSPI